MMDDLVGNLLRAYRQSISALDWMSEETKQAAYDKLDRFRSKIGYPETFRDYSSLDFVPDDLLGNVAAANAFETRRQLAKIGAPVDRDEWLMLPQTVNAYYRPGMNEICFPAAILQKPFFSPGRRRRPRTTAASARSSATRSGTASTTRARSTTAPATSTTGGRPTTRRVPGEGAGADRAVQRASRRATCPASTSTAR